MDTGNNKEIYSLTETALLLGVPVSTLVGWNENNILKPTIINTGEVVYRQEQINQFLEIKKLSQEIKLTNPNEILNQVKHDNSKHFSVSSFVALTVIVTTVTVISLTQQAIFKTDTSGTENIGTVLATPVSESVLSASSTAEPQLVLKNKDESNNNAMLATDEKVSDRPATIAAVFDNNLIANNFNYSESMYKSSADSVFDDGGNLKGETTNGNLLAATFNYNGIIPSTNPVRQNTDVSILVALLALGGVSLLFIFKKPVTSYATQDPEAVSLDTADDQKVIELNQKTDGTVVLCIQGQEFKVSKPELDSESDQFIERLMGLVTPKGVKEIDYDAFADGEIRLSAPLSKIVTRLGFVGLKRDLFFPRTSKNRVLFRRFLTTRDLTAMHISTDQIKSEFITSN